MRHTNHSIVTHRRLLLFKWLMVVIPPLTFAMGHTLVLVRPEHTVGGLADPVIVSVFATCLTLALAYGFVETLFGVLRKLQAEALAREQDILTLNAVMGERERLGRELHDGAAQLVAHLLLRLDTIKELVASGQSQEAAAELERLRGVADEIYEDIGESISGIRTDVAAGGLIRTLKDYADQFEERHQIPVRLRTDEAADLLSPLAAFQLFRFVQEALTNVRKHAGAREALVSVEADGADRLTVVVADDGQGFTPGGSGRDAGRPLGLTSMRERVEGLGGTIHVTSRPGSGTRVTATVPLECSEEAGHAARTYPVG